MKYLLSVAIAFLSASSFAELKRPGSVSLSACGRNEIKGYENITEVCLATLSGLRPSQQGIRYTQSNGLLVSVYANGAMKQYFYKAEDPLKSNVSSEEFKLVGLVVNGNLTATTMTLPRDTTVVTKRIQNGGISLAGRFLGSNFYSSKLSVILTTM